MNHCVVQLALTLAGAYLSFYVANGPCEFSGKPPFKRCLVPFIFTLLPFCSNHARRLICASQHVPHDLVITVETGFGNFESMIQHKQQQQQQCDAASAKTKTTSQLSWYYQKLHHIAAAAVAASAAAAVDY